MSPEFVFAFCITVFVASIIPGPSMLLALTHGMRYGVRRTMASALGNVLVTLIQALVSILGLGAVLLASETVFLMIKWAGAAYLVYMGISLLRSGDLVFGAQTPGEGAAHKMPLNKLFVQGVLVTAGNPKAIVFFTAVFPLFLHPGAGFMLQCTCLLSLLCTIAFACFMLYALGGQRIVGLFSRAGAGRWVRRIIGTSFIGAGIGLAAARRG